MKSEGKKQKVKQGLVVAVCLVPLAFCIPGEARRFADVHSLGEFLIGLATAWLLSMFLAVAAFLARYAAVRFVYGDSDANDVRQQERETDVLSFYCSMAITCVYVMWVTRMGQ